MNRCQYEAPPRADYVAPGQAECRMSNKEFRMMKFDGFVKSQKAAFRSWFDTSPRTENQALGITSKRSP
jgi:hypothetical protein